MKALDLFCGAGGASMGIHRAGFEVTGVDIKPQPRYPFQFIQADAMEFPLEGYDFVWASPPCQRYTHAQHAAKNRDAHPDLVPETREKLIAWGGPWIMENVPGSPVFPHFILCGSMFGLELRRHRLFETSAPIFSLVPKCDHSRKIYSVFGHGSGNRNRSDWGTVADWKRAMGIDWMVRDELSQAIPPAYSEFLCRQVMRVLTTSVDVAQARE